jgi:hypothetical protein
LGSSLAIATGVIVGHNIFHSFKHVTVLQGGLMVLFLLMVGIFVGEQTNALTLTSTSSACGEANMLVTVGDQFSRISGLILGLHIVAIEKSRRAMFGLFGWTIARLGISLKHH